MTQLCRNSDDLPTHLLTEARRHVANGLEFEYEDGYEEVRMMKKGMGLGIARFGLSGDEASKLRKQLCAIGKKGETVSDGETFDHVTLTTYDSFVEVAYRVKTQRKADP